MSALPPSPGLPFPRPPTAEPPGPGGTPPGEPVPAGGPQLAPVVAGAIGVAVGAGLALAIALPLTVSGAPRSNVLTDAVAACDSPEGVILEDDGMTLAFDHRGEDEVTGGDITGIMCVFGELEMPSRISTHMGQTTSMDGRQAESWDGLEIQWSYHPDRGMDGMVTVTTE